MFVLSAIAHSGSTVATADQITDFAQGTDLIDLHDIDARRNTPGANDAFVFIGAAAFGLIAGQLRCEQVAGDT